MPRTRGQERNSTDSHAAFAQPSLAITVANSARMSASFVSVICTSAASRSARRRSTSLSAFTRR